VFPVAAAFAFGGEALGNDSNEIRIAIGIRNDQQASFSVQPHGDPSWFIMMVVLKCQRSIIMKHGFCFSEADALVLEFVGCVFCLVILNLE